MLLCSTGMHNSFVCVRCARTYSHITINGSATRVCISFAVTIEMRMSGDTETQVRQHTHTIHVHDNQCCRSSRRNPTSFESGSGRWTCTLLEPVTSSRHCCWYRLSPQEVLIQIVVGVAFYERMMTCPVSRKSERHFFARLLRYIIASSSLSSLLLEFVCIYAHVQARISEFPDDVAHAVELSVASLQEVLTRTKTCVTPFSPLNMCRRIPAPALKNRTASHRSYAMRLTDKYCFVVRTYLYVYASAPFHLPEPSDAHSAADEADWRSLPQAASCAVRELRLVQSIDAIVSPSIVHRAEPATSR